MTCKSLAKEENRDHLPTLVVGRNVLGIANYGHKLRREK
jgi:hypothetical protein